MADIMLSGVKESWKKIILSPRIKPIFEDCVSKLEERAELSATTPEVSKILQCFKYFEANECNAIIIGQDPYPRKGVATGLSFSCDTKQPSVTNIFKCLKHHGKISEIPETGNLEVWAHRGILLLNTLLTRDVGSGEEGKHLFWYDFTSEIIKFISAKLKSRDIYIMLWGNEAKKLSDCVSGRLKLLTWGHPSPMVNWNKDKKDKRNFLYCDHFNYVDIDWSIGESMISEISTVEPCDGMYVMMFTDGACEGNGKDDAFGSFAAYFPETYRGIPNAIVGNIIGIVQQTTLRLEGTNVVGAGDYIKATNNRAELLAILWPLQYLAANFAGKIGHLIAVIDNRIAQNALDDCLDPNRKWQKMANPDLVGIIRQLYNICNPRLLTTYHQDSHTNLTTENANGNRIVDALTKKIDDVIDINFNLHVVPEAHVVPAPPSVD